MLRPRLPFCRCRVSEGSLIVSTRRLDVPLDCSDRPITQPVAQSIIIVRGDVASKRCGGLAPARRRENRTTFCGDATYREAIDAHATGRCSVVVRQYSRCRSRRLMDRWTNVLSGDLASSLNLRSPESGARLDRRLDRGAAKATCRAAERGMALCPQGSPEQQSADSRRRRKDSQWAREAHAREPPMLGCGNQLHDATARRGELHLSPDQIRSDLLALSALLT